MAAAKTVPCFRKAKVFPEHTYLCFAFPGLSQSPGHYQLQDANKVSSKRRGLELFSKTTLSKTVKVAIHAQETNNHFS